MRTEPLFGHVVDLLRLAAPVVVARSGVMVLIFVDTVMVGRFSSEQLAFLGIAMAPIMVLIVTSIGLLMGTLVVTAGAFGGGRHRDCGAAWRRSLPYAVVVGGAAAGVCALGGDVLAFLGQPASLADGGGPVLRALGFGVPGFLLYITTAFFLEGLRRPLPGMVAMLIANAVNVGLNWILIYGNLGFPAMGAEGAAWATTAVRTGLAVALVAYVLTMVDHETFGVRRAPTGGWRGGATQRRIGFAAGAAIGGEALAFGIVNLFAGLLGEVATAAYAISFNLFAMVFMVAIGLGAATAIRVGIATGAGDTHGRDMAAWTGLGVNTVAMGGLAIVFASVPSDLVAAYTEDPTVAAVAVTLVSFMAWILVFDGGQAVMANALRGRGDTWVTTGLQAFAFIGVMVPAAWALAFVLKRGVVGLYEAVLIATALSLGLLCIRFVRLSRRGADALPESGPAG